MPPIEPVPVTVSTRPVTVADNAPASIAAVGSVGELPKPEKSVPQMSASVPDSSLSGARTGQSAGVLPTTVSGNPSWHWDELPALRACWWAAVVTLGWVAVDGLAELGVMLRWWEESLLIERLRFWTAVALPVLAAANVWLWWHLAQSGGPASVARRSQQAGRGVILGGAVFDLSMTLWHSPDLSWEANPYIRAVLDAGWSLQQVYVHLLVTQVLFIGLFLLVWDGWWRHHPKLVESVTASQAQHWLQFLKAATGAGHLSDRAWIMPLRPAEVPYFYHCIWVCAVAVVLGISVFRWYAGLEWLNVFEPDWSARSAVIASAVGAALGVYLAILWQRWRSTLTAEASPDSQSLC